jgi:hypothetical protein
LRGCGARILQGCLHTPETPLPGWDRHVISIAAEGIADELGINFGATVAGLLQCLKDKNTRSG